MKIQFQYHDQIIEFGAQHSESGWQAKAELANDESKAPIALPQIKAMNWLENSLLELVLENRVIQIPVVKQGDKRLISWNGRVYVFEQLSNARRAGAAAHSDGKLNSPMPCMVAKISVQVGEQVNAHQELLAIEAMKTVQTITAPFDGTVKQIYVQEKELVGEGAPLIEIAHLQESEP